MIKHVFIGFLNGFNEIDAAGWYFRYHCKEVVRFVGPWLRRYETFRAYPPPPEARLFGIETHRFCQLQMCYNNP